MNTITLYQPSKLVFGNGSYNDFVSEFLELPYNNILIVADPNIRKTLSGFLKQLKQAGKSVQMFTEIPGEPTIGLFSELRDFAEKNSVEAVIGIGGGSVLDIAKLTAALSFTEFSVDDVMGTGKISHRPLFLACLPTTAGTGSEVSPNAILLDEKDNMKKGIISKFLLPDITYVDPELTHTVPPAVTASTGIDALTHCIEAYANKFAHPVTDKYAAEGVQLIMGSLLDAYRDGKNAGAREKVALGSLYGGLCLGPVNTAAVHALAYPLGGEYHIPHGISNAILLPHVMRSNLPDAAEKYAKLGSGHGGENSVYVKKKALNFIDSVDQLCRDLDIPDKLSSFNVPEGDIGSLTDTALTVERLLKNNMRRLTAEEISAIYKKLF